MPPKKRTIQDIKPSKKATTVRNKVSTTRKKAVKALETKDLKDSRSSAAKRSKKSEPSKILREGKSIWILVVVVFAFFLSAFSLLFSGSTVVITPKQVTLPDGKILLSGEKDSTEGLSFQSISVDGERSVLIKSSDSSPVERGATGVVTIYNNHSTKNQNLLIDTRILGSNGVIYKTKTAAVIPGQKKADGDLVPGKIDVEVYADVLGVSGNLGMSDFSIVGFKGTSKEQSFYGRSKTEINGGFNGLLHSLTQDIAILEKEKLRDLLKNDLKSKLEAQIPEGYILIDNSEEYVVLDKNDRYESDTESVEVFEKGSLIALIADSNILAESVARETVTTYVEGDRIYLNNIESLLVALVGSPIGIDALEEINISVKGKPSLVWILDEDKIKYNLVGTRKKQFETVMSRYEYVNKAKLKIRPFWRSKLPEEIEDIEITYYLD
ncbi:MAG: hypothetical protein ACI88L_000117 [Candidatus Paceibacteria bacterium]|jgi:hypothetical protein